ncbi:energy transducer TonB [Sphingomonas sp.]|uniref:energy transducer TonB n=1 Tax=Sphingomonas sp. TaxID=28214 RepID=UPI00286E3938|nr:energy transducer TonB [Sphingomonas sp.]
MYRTDLKPRDKGGAMVAVVAIHAGLAFALLHLSGTVDVTAVQRELQVFDVRDIVAPPPPPPVERQVEKEKPKEKEGASAPKNIKSEATPVVAPKPRVELPLPPTIVAAEIPKQGANPTQGAAPVRGPGTGAGGIGTGTGSGGAGSGGGGGGDGLAATRTRLATRPLGGRDFPRAMLDAWPRGAWAFMRFRVDADGNIIQCIIDRSTGVRAIDDQVCAVARQRLRFRPALDRNGRRVADWAAYGQEPPR